MLTILPIRWPVAGHALQPIDLMNAALLERGAEGGIAAENGLVVMAGDLFLAGVALYPTNGYLLLVEFLVTNKDAPLRLTHDAVSCLAIAVQTYALAICKVPVIRLPRARRLPGLERILRATGWLQSPEGTEFSAPSHINIPTEKDTPRHAPTHRQAVQDPEAPHEPPVPDPPVPARQPDAAPQGRARRNRAKR